MIYEPFSIAIVPFPFTDKLQTKRRPALVLSSRRYQKDTGHVTLLMITSAKNSHWNSDYLIKDMHTTGLASPSIVRQKLFTIDNRLIIDCLGKLSSNDVKEIKSRVAEHIAVFSQ